MPSPALRAVRFGILTALLGCGGKVVVDALPDGGGGTGGAGASTSTSSAPPGTTTSGLTSTGSVMSSTTSGRMPCNVEQIGCTGGNDGSCDCTGTCDMSTAEVKCGGNGVGCTCLFNGVQIATCNGGGGPQACDFVEGCCASFL